jgi:hypothetical protein
MKLNSYILTCDNKGEYVRDSFSADRWDTTSNCNDAKVIRASSPRRAIDRFCLEAGISIRYRGGDWDVTDRNLNGFSLGLLSDARALEQEAA